VFLLKQGIYLNSSNFDVSGKFKGIGVVDLIVYDVGAGAPYVTNSD